MQQNITYIYSIHEESHIEGKLYTEYMPLINVLLKRINLMQKLQSLHYIQNTHIS